MATSTAPRKLDGKKAQRIVSAMRSSVAERGAAGSTFDHVAQEAGVSRGLLHYYFGSKERLLVEVVRHDCDVRMELLERRLSTAASAEELIDVMVAHLESLIANDPATFALIFELFTASRHNEDLAEAMGDLYREVRAQVARVLSEKEQDGAIRLRGEPEAVASLLFALGDGLALQRLSDPDWDSSAAFAVGIETARLLLTSPGE